VASLCGLPSHAREVAKLSPLHRLPPLKHSLALGGPHKKEKHEKAHKVVNENSDWAQLAVRLTGESDEIRQEALKLLKKLKTLKAQLRTALWTHQRPLALDVIATLKIKALLPELLKISASDEDGFVYLTINSLIDDKNYKKVVELYLRRLTHPVGKRIPSPAAKIAILDSLGRLRQALEAESVEDMMGTQSEPDIQRAVLSYVRNFLLRKEHPEYWNAVERATRAKSYEVRVQAYFLVSEVQKSFEHESAKLWSRCESDSNSELSALCLKLRNGEFAKK
jgi:hypothetical protein